jgi:hypothetical protein
MRIAALLLLAPGLAGAEELLLVHHGMLFDANDAPVNGPVTITVTLYPRSDSGPAGALWTDTFETTAFKGRYGVVLGDTEALHRALTAADLAGERWMAVRVGDDGELQPRLRLGSVATALHAFTAASADDAAHADLAGVALALDAEATVAGGRITGAVARASVADALDANAQVPAAQVNGKVASAASADVALALDAAVRLPASRVDGKIAAAAEADVAGALAATATVPAAQVTGLAAVATTGAYSSLSGAPDLAGFAARAGDQTFSGANTFSGTAAVTGRLILPTATPGTCNASLAGAIWFDPAAGKLYGCGANGWVTIGGAASSGAGTQTNPATSCRALHDGYPNLGDEIYWLDPDGPSGAGSPFRAFCDMTRDNGGWTRVVNVRGNSLAHADQPGAVGDVSDANAAAKLSDATINVLNTVGYWRVDCGSSLKAFVKNAENTFTSMKTNSMSWRVDRDRDGNFECAGNRSGYVFSDYPDCSSTHVLNYAAAGGASEGYGCWSSGWNKDGFLWAK